jgi:hypothetical protein
MEARPEVNPETVQSLRDAARKLLDDETARAASLNSRATALTGFVGVILSLGAAVGVGVGSSTVPATLSDWARIVIAVLAALALVALVLSVALVVVKVLRPLPGLTFATAEVDGWIKPAFTDLPTVQVNGYLTDGYAQAIHADRLRNNSKALWLNRGYVIVAMSLALIAAAGALATIDRYVAVRGHQPIHTSSKPAAAHN